MTSHELVYKPPAPPEAAPIGEPASEETELVRPSGPAAAVVVAAGLACFTLGLLSVLTAASGRVSDALTLSDGVGDVSGISIAAVAVFFGAWAALTFAWRRADPPLTAIAIASGTLIALGLLGTFPPFFNMFG
jgi:hypothetical protein